MLKTLFNRQLARARQKSPLCVYLTAPNTLCDCRDLSRLGPVKLSLDVVISAAWLYASR